MDPGAKAKVDPSGTMWKLVKDLDVSERTVGRMGLMSHVKRWHQLLSKASYKVNVMQQ